MECVVNREVERSVRLEIGENKTRTLNGTGDARSVIVR